MSDMIDRLKSVSRAAGRDVASGLADRSTIAELAGRVRHGVRRRRIRIGAIGATVAAVVGATAVAAPTLLRSLPDGDNVIEPGILRTVGPITTYDDASISVVLSSGRTVNLPAYEGDLVFQQTSRDQLCEVSSPEDLPPNGWVPTDGEANRIIRQVTLWDKMADGTRTPVMSAVDLGTRSTDELNSLIATVQVDPAVAPFVALRVTTWDFKVMEADDGSVAYRNVLSQAYLDGEPEPEYSGSADLGTRVGTLETRPTDMGEWSACYKMEDVLTPGLFTGPYVGYVVVEIFLVDHKGGSYPLGIATYWYEFEMSDG